MTNPTTTNPYDILDVSPASSQAEIVMAVASALKARRHPPQTIAAAQKWLMNPDKRLLADYLRPILPSVQRLKPLELPEAPPEAPELRLNPDLTGLNVELAALQERAKAEAAAHA